jgi:hypothetical protein
MNEALDTPTALLGAARQLIDGQVAGTSGAWPRASALLARQALEEAVRSLWDGRFEAARSCSATHQLLCSRVVLGEQLAGEAFQVWAALSQACHVHAYELGPVVAELHDWINAVERVVERVER